MIKGRQSDHEKDKIWRYIICQRLRRYGKVWGGGDIESPGIVEGEREKEHIRKEKRMVIMWKAQRR